jgi:hypothetical protein
MDTSSTLLRTFVVLNKRSGTTISHSVALAGTSSERRRGLKEVDDLAEGQGLWISPCEAIHTFGMKTPIDAIFIDRDGCVRKLYASIPPRRIGWCFTADSVIELSTGVIERSKTKVGDHLELVRNTQSVGRH